MHAVGSHYHTQTHIYYHAINVYMLWIFYIKHIIICETVAHTTAPGTLGN